MSENKNPKRRASSKRYVLISVVAKRLDLHPQTIRMYEREGLIKPTRSAGNTRLYDDRAIRRLEMILNLTRELGVNLAGVEVILNMKERIDRLEAELDELKTITHRLTRDRRAGVDPRHALVKVKVGLPTKR